MRAAPLVSVIIPAYNAADTIAETLASVLAQSCRDLEVIVVDDGSTDDTLGVVRDVSTQDSRVRHVTQANAGCGAARNGGVRDARGRYVASVDADDLWHRDKLAMQLAAHGERPGILVLCGLRRFTVDEGPWRWLSETLPLSLDVPEHEVLDAVVGLHGHQMALFNTFFCERTAIEALGGWSETLPTAEDWDLGLRAARRLRLVCVNEALLYYRKHAASLTARGHAKRVTAVHLSLIEREWALGGVSRRAYRRAVRECHLALVQSALYHGDTRVALGAWTAAGLKSGAPFTRRFWGYLRTLAWTPRAPRQ